MAIRPGAAVKADVLGLLPMEEVVCKIGARVSRLLPILEVVLKRGLGASPNRGDNFEKKIK